MSYNGKAIVPILSPEIDCTGTGPFTIGTTLSGSQKFCITQVLIVLTDISGLTSIPQNWSMGTNNPDYNEYMSGQTADLETTGEFKSLGLQSVIPSSAGGVSIVAKLGIAAVATTYKVRFVLTGYYV